MFLNTHFNIIVLQLSTLRYDDWQLGFVVWTSWNVFDFPHYQETVKDTTKNDMLVIEEIAFGTCYKKLASVRVLAAVRHRQQSRSIMLEDKVFVVECSTVNAVNTGAIALNYNY